MLLSFHMVRQWLFSVQNHNNNGYNTTTADQNFTIPTLNVGMLSPTGCEAMTLLLYHL